MGNGQSAEEKIKTCQQLQMDFDKLIILIISIKKYQNEFSQFIMKQEPVKSMNILPDIKLLEYFHKNFGVGFEIFNKIKFSFDELEQNEKKKLMIEAFDIMTDHLNNLIDKLKETCVKS